MFFCRFHSFFFLSLLFAVISTISLSFHSFYSDSSFDIHIYIYLVIFFPDFFTFVVLFLFFPIISLSLGCFSAGGFRFLFDRFNVFPRLFFSNSWRFPSVSSFSVCVFSFVSCWSWTSTVGIYFAPYYLLLESDAQNIASYNYFDNFCFLCAVFVVFIRLGFLSSFCLWFSRLSRLVMTVFRLWLEFQKNDVWALLPCASRKLRQTTDLCPPTFSCSIFPWSSAACGSRPRSEARCISYFEVQTNRFEEKKRKKKQTWTEFVTPHAPVVVACW